jgi:hypothetical protein
MKTFLPGASARFVVALLILPTIAAGAPNHSDRGIPQPQGYAALLAKARAGTLRINHAEAPERPQFFLFRAAKGPASGIFPPTAYRADAKTSFAASATKTFSNLGSLFDPLPTDSKMSHDFPALVTKTHNTSARVDLEKWNVKVNAWIFWVASESDHDFHVIRGNTAQLTSTTVFMNSEISGLPEATPTKSPFPQRRADIRHIFENHENAGGLFVKPVPVTISGSLLWDGEHRFPNTVGPEGLQPAKAWDIHPIKQLTER